jgi:hypothetical protein
MDSSDYQTIRQLLDDYLQMYASRDERLTVSALRGFHPPLLTTIHPGGVPTA